MSVTKLVQKMVLVKAARVMLVESSDPSINLIGMGRALQRVNEGHMSQWEEIDCNGDPEDKWYL